MEWKWLINFGSKIDPELAVMMVVIFWLMRQNSGLQREAFSLSATVTKLPVLLEGLVYGRRGNSGK